MFEKTTESIFRFLEDEHRFTRKVATPRVIRYEKAGIFIRLSHTELDEISLSVGHDLQGAEVFFSGSVLWALTSPKEGFSMRDRISSNPTQIRQSLQSHADLLRQHGQRVLAGDASVFSEMEQAVEAHWQEVNDAQTRRDAQSAFTAKEYGKALRSYRLLEERATLLDRKRMEICERHLSA